MMGILKVELTKLLKKSSTRVFIVLYTIILIGMSILYTVAEKVYDLSIYSGTQFVGASLGTMMAFLLPLMAVYLASSSQSIDFSRGTMKNMYLLPISRTKLFMSKIVAVQAILGSVITIHFAITLIVSFIIDGLTISSIGTIFVDYLGAFLILGLINAIGTIIALLVKNTGLAVILAYVGYIGLSILTIYVPSISGISITTLINDYANFFRQGAITMLLSTLAYYIILFITGLLIFEKKEESLCQFD